MEKIKSLKLCYILCLLSIPTAFLVTAILGNYLWEFDIYDFETTVFRYIFIIMNILAVINAIESSGRKTLNAEQSSPKENKPDLE